MRTPLRPANMGDVVSTCFDRLATWILIEIMDPPGGFEFVLFSSGAAGGFDCMVSLYSGISEGGMITVPEGLVFICLGVDVSGLSFFNCADSGFWLFQDVRHFV